MDSNADVSSEESIRQPTHLPLDPKTNRSINRSIDHDDEISTLTRIREIETRFLQPPEHCYASNSDIDSAQLSRSKQSYMITWYRLENRSKT